MKKVTKEVLFGASPVTVDYLKANGFKKTGGEARVEGFWKKGNLKIYEDITGFYALEGEEKVRFTHTLDLEKYSGIQG